MSNARTLAAFLAGAVVALPGLALAQAPFETPPVETPPVEVPEAADEDADEAPEAEEVEPEEVDDVRTLEAQDDEDDGHGEVVSALAACMPSGAELHGTGLTKGFVMRQATSGEVSLGDDTEPLALGSPDDAQAVCEAVGILVDDVEEAPETAKGRPDWARSNDDEAAPGAWGRDRAAEARADQGR